MKKSLRSILEDITERGDYVELPLAAEEQSEYRTPDQVRRAIAQVKKEMLAAAADLDFETAAERRDKMLALEKQELALRGTPVE